MDVFALLMAVFSLLASLTVAAFTARQARRLEELRNRLAGERREKDARLDYEYEARRRLYRELEPLLFQLREESEAAWYRLLDIAKHARCGELDPEKDDGLLAHHDRYLMLSTVYQLFVPAVVVRLIKEKLTMVDLAVEPRLRTQYELAKLLYRSYSDDTALAEIDPKLEYLPSVEDYETRRRENPAVYWRQGLQQKDLERIVEALTTDNGRAKRPLTFGEFMRRDKSDLQVLFDILERFHPAERPVLWRVLIVQAHLFRAFASASPDDERTRVRFFSAEEQQGFSWQVPDEKRAFAVPFAVAEAYLDERVPRLIAAR